jgi:hypothetical protein
MSGYRLCACGCGASLAGLRSDAVYVSEAHAKAHRRRDSADKARTRRPSREGKGAKVYLTPAELRTVEEGLFWMDLPDSPAGRKLKAKIEAAVSRVS